MQANRDPLLASSSSRSLSHHTRFHGAAHRLRCTQRPLSSVHLAIGSSVYQHSGPARNSFQQSKSLQSKGSRYTRSAYAQQILLLSHSFFHQGKKCTHDVSPL